MSTQIQSLNKRKNELLDQKETVLKNCVDLKKNLTDSEKEQFKNLNGEIDSIDFQLSEAKKIAQGRQEIGTPVTSATVSTNDRKPKFYALGGTHKFGSQNIMVNAPTAISEEYNNGLWAALKNGKQGFDKFMIQNAALGEGGTTADGSALVPISTDPNIPNLAPYECSARSLSTVRTTEMNINIPYQSARASAAIKSESNNSGTNAFGVAIPQFATTELQAYMVGNSVYVSWELLQDSKYLSSFVSAELQRVITAAEENYFINGTGSSQPQGYVGNGATPTGSTITAGDASIASSGIKPILETVASLNPNYYRNAKWLVHRQEYVRLLEAQLATSQLLQFMTLTTDGQHLLNGFPVVHSYEMPVYAASPSTSGHWLFGDFSAFAVIGDRGDSNIRFKVLDQVAALNGQTVFLGYRRTDQRIVLQEAVQELITTG
jgi:HK97 family phage major capsid protein